jgi:hypothetical protein
MLTLLLTIIFSPLEIKCYYLIGFKPIFQKYFKIMLSWHPFPRLSIVCEVATRQGFQIPSLRGHISTKTREKDSQWGA